MGQAPSVHCTEKDHVNINICLFMFDSQLQDGDAQQVLLQIDNLFVEYH